MATAFASSIPCSRAQMHHCRSTERVESTRTPSRSKRMAAQRKVVILFFITKRVSGSEPEGFAEEGPTLPAALVRGVANGAGGNELWHAHPRPAQTSS